jgi:hypothetical protein
MLNIEADDFWPDVDIEFDYLYEDERLVEGDYPLDINELTFNDIDEY